MDDPEAHIASLLGAHTSARPHRLNAIGRTLVKEIDSLAAANTQEPLEAIQLPCGSVTVVVLRRPSGWEGYAGTVPKSSRIEYHHCWSIELPSVLHDLRCFLTKVDVVYSTGGLLSEVEILLKNRHRRYTVQRIGPVPDLLWNPISRQEVELLETIQIGARTPLNALTKVAGTYRFIAMSGDGQQSGTAENLEEAVETLLRFVDEGI